MREIENTNRHVELTMSQELGAAARSTKFSQCQSRAAQNRGELLSERPGLIVGSTGTRSETDRRSKTADRPTRKRIAYTKQQE